MGGQEDLIRVMDATLEKSEIKEVISALQPLKEEIRTFSGISIFTKSTAGAAEFRVQSEQLQAALEKIRLIEIQLEALRAKNHAANRSRTDQEIADSQKTAQATRTRVAEIRSEEDAYRKLTNEYNKHSQAVKIAAAQYGVHSKEAKAATAALQPFAVQMQAVNKAADDGRSRVGRYAEGIKEFGRELLTAGAAFFGLQQGISFLKESLAEFGKAEVAMIRLRGILSNMGRVNEIDSVKRSIKELSEQFKTIKPDEFTDIFQRLYTFGHLSTNMMRELIPVIVNFASKQGIDVAEATGVMEKAMEGNARALKEYGINMKEGKDETERFGIIMSELAPRVKDAETMFEDTFPGALKKTQVEIEELKKDIGSDLVPVTKMWFELLKGEIGGLRIFTDYITNLWKAIKGGGNIFEALTTNPEDRRVESEESDNRAKKLANYYLSLDKFKDQDKNKQEKLLSVYNSQLKTQMQQYDVAKKTAELTGKNASTATPFDDFGKLLIDADNKAQAQAKFRLEQIATTKYMLQQAGDIMTGDTVVNQGGKKGPTDEEIKKEIEAQAKLYQMRLQAAIDYQKVLADEKNNTIASRTEAYEKLVDLEQRQVEGERDLKLKNTKLTEGEREVIIEEAAEKMMKYQVENIGRLAQIRYDALNNDKVLAAENGKELEAIEAAHQKTMEDIRKAALERQAAFIDDAKNIELLANDRDYKSGKIDKKQHSKRADDIEFNAQKAKLTDNVTSADKLLAADPNNATLQDNDTKAKLALSTLLTNKEISDQDKIDAHKKAAKDREIEAAKEVGHAIESFVTGAYERQINTIQKQIDKNNELKEKETQSIATSTLSLQEKAAAQILLDAQVNANNEALQRKQRDIRVKEAKFNRDAAVLEMIEQGTIAALAALKDGLVLGEAEAIAIGVFTAAQVASVLAKPIPTYRGGVKSKPEDGLMKVHPNEIRIDPDGTMSMTPDAPETLTYGKRGTRIIPAHEANKVIGNSVNRQMMNEMIRMTAFQIDNRKELQEIKEAIQEGTMAQIREMGKKKPDEIHIHFDPKFSSHIDNAVRN